MSKPYTDIVPAQDRGRMTAFGALLKTASMGKRAGLLDEVMDTGTRGLVMFSLITGVPIGIAAHLIAAKTRARDMQEQEMDAKIKYYRSAGQNVEQGLANEGITA